MNCAEFKRVVGADPHHLSVEASAHRETCEACRGYAQSMLALDAKLSRALQLPITRPNTFRIPETRPAGSRWYALAASVLLALGVGISVWLGGSREALAAEVVGHMQGEIASMTVTDERSDSHAVEETLARAGVRLHQSLAVSYLQTCPFRGDKVPHLVVQTARGPVTVLVLRNEHVKGKQNFRESGYSGVLVPVGPGTLAVMAADDATVTAAVIEIEHAVEWN